MKRLALYGIALILAVPSTVAARTWYISPDGTGDAPTIQAGIDSAQPGDEVVLADGTFTGNGNRDITYTGKAITIRSESGDPDLCIIDCDGSPATPHRGFCFTYGEGRSSVLEGVTIANGYFDQGGAIYCVGSPTIRNCKLIGNCVSDIGGGAVIGYCCPLFSYCDFIWNHASRLGGGVWCLAYSQVFEHCSFVENTAGSGGGIYTDDGENLFVDHCTFWHNTASGGGAGMGCGGVNHVHVTNCTFCANQAPQGGGIGGGFCVVPCSLTVSNSIIAYSIAGEAIYWGNPNTIFMTCCDLYGNAGGDYVGSIADRNGTSGNFSACPSFCYADLGDFHLCDESPCAPGNHPYGYDCGLVGAWDVGCSCGPTQIEPTSWGLIKNMYR
jgi:predicted outer membrane repeat protein